MKNNTRSISVLLCVVGVSLYWLVSISLLVIATVFTQNEYLSKDNWETISLITQLIGSFISTGIVIKMHLRDGVLAAVCIFLGCIITSFSLSIAFFGGMSNLVIWDIVSIAVGCTTAFVALGGSKNKAKSKRKRIHHP